MGAECITFFGGEPLLRKDLPELIKCCSESAMGSIIETNALKLDLRMAQRLKEAGLNTASMSIDSTDPETHDRLRGVKGTFNKMMSAVEYCKELGINVHWSAYADKQKLNDGGLEAILNLARKMGVKVRIITPILAGKGLEAEEYDLDRKDIENWRSLLDPEVAFWEQETCSNPDAEFRCISREREFFYITCYGDVTPCCYVPLAFGNLRKEPLVSIIKRMWNHDIYELATEAGCLMNEKAFRDRYIEQMRTAPWHPIYVD